QQFGALERERAIRARNARDAISTARSIEERLGIEDGLAENPSLEELRDLAARFAKAQLEERTVVEERVRRLYQRVGELRGVRDRFERELGLVGERVDLEQAQAE